MKPNNLQLQINQPCNANWESMTPCKDGRHCDSCNKTVVDFSKMSVWEIKVYFTQKAEKETCGHFYKNQLDNNHSLFQDRLLSGYRKAAHFFKNKFTRMAALFILGTLLGLTGCNSHKENDQVDGGISPVPSDAASKANDTVKHS